MNLLKRTVKSAFHAVGLDVVRRQEPSPINQRYPTELTREDREIVDYVKSRRLTSVEEPRLWATVMACKYVVERGIEGDFVECGVWRGGLALAAAAVFRRHRSARRVHLFDTFAGMTPPGERDTSLADDTPALAEFQRHDRATHNEWCYAPLDEVRGHFRDAGLLDDSIVFVQGDVRRTLDDPSRLPAQIAVLRLDTDWYESTRKELRVLYPRLRVGGVLLIDDYGHWAGSRKATDEYFSSEAPRPFLQYTDYAGRTGVKV